MNGSELATWRQRLGEALIDRLMIGLWVIPIAGIVVSRRLVLAQAIIAAYYLISNTRGASLGKLALRLRIVRADGQAPGLVRGTLRSLDSLALLAVSFIVAGNHGALFVAGSVVAFGYAMLLWHPERRTLYDRFAGTIVVRREPASGTVVL